MTLFEIFVPRGVLTQDARRRLGERMVTEVLNTNGAPADLIDRARGLAHVIIHEPETWSVAGRPVSATDPRYVVRVTLPGGHLTGNTRAELVSRITMVVAAFDATPERVYAEPRVWVQIHEVPDGNLGAFGRIVPTADVIKMVVTPDWTPTDHGPQADAGTRPNEVIDPICGMTVELNEHAITLEHDGIVYGFCATSCRDIFARQHALAVT